LDRVSAALQYAALLPLLPLAEASPADTVVQVFRRIETAAAPGGPEAS
jgi:hypothetical protein